MNNDLRDKILSFRQSRVITIFGEDIETFDKEMLIATCHLLARDIEIQRNAGKEQREMWFDMLKAATAQERPS